MGGTGSREGPQQHVHLRNLHHGHGGRQPRLVVGQHVALRLGNQLAAACTQTQNRKWRPGRQVVFKPNGVAVKTAATESKTSSRPEVEQ